MTNTALLNTLEALVQNRLGNASSAFRLVLAALQNSQTLQASLATPDGWLAMYPLACHLAYTADLLPDLDTYLFLLQPSKGPLATVLPFVLLFALSRVRSEQPIPQQPDSAHPHDSAHDGEPALQASGGSSLSGEQRPAKRPCTALQPRSLASNACTKAHRGACRRDRHAARGVPPVPEQGGPGVVRAEPATLSDSPAQAALEIVIDSMAGERAQRMELAARLALCVSPCWNGRTPEPDMHPLLQGLPIHWEGQPAVRRLLQMASHIAHGHYISAEPSAFVRCTLGGRELKLSVDIGVPQGADVRGLQHSTLRPHIEPVHRTEPAHFAQQLYHMEAEAVKEEHLPALAAGDCLPSSGGRYSIKWAKPTCTGAAGVDYTVEKWALRIDLEGDFPGMMFICVDVRVS